MTDYTDRKQVLEAVSDIGWTLQYAHEDLKRDQEIVLMAVLNDGSALEHAHEDIKRDRKIVLKAVLNDEGALKFVHKDFKQKIKSYTPKSNIIYNLYEMVKDEEIAKNTKYLKQFYADIVFTFH